MMAAARTLSDAEIEDLGALYGRDDAVPVGSGSAEAATIVRLGIPARDIPACDSCHGAEARPGYPRLDDQDAGYLQNQLKLFKELGPERGGPNGHIMAEVVRYLEEDEMEALADFYGR
jgi:cytochrome c553